MVRGVERSRWLGELAQAIDDAQHLVCAYGICSGPSGDLLDLCARLEVLRREIDEIRRGRTMMRVPIDSAIFRQSDAFAPSAP